MTSRVLPTAAIQNVSWSSWPHNTMRTDIIAAQNGWWMPRQCKVNNVYAFAV
jgi:hypothetical protein